MEKDVTFFARGGGYYFEMVWVTDPKKEETDQQTENWIFFMLKTGNGPKKRGIRSTN